MPFIWVTHSILLVFYHFVLIIHTSHTQTTGAVKLLDTVMFLFCFFIMSDFCWYFINPFFFPFSSEMLPEPLPATQAQTNAPLYLTVEEGYSLHKILLF